MQAQFAPQIAAAFDDLTVDDHAAAQTHVPMIAEMDVPEAPEPKIVAWPQSAAALASFR